jgi:hypothetical protein
LIQGWWEQLIEYFTEKTLRILLIIVVVLALILWWGWIRKFGFYHYPLLVALGIGLLNTLASFWLFRREILAAQFLLANTIFIFLLSFVLLFRTYF